MFRDGVTLLGVEEMCSGGWWGYLFLCWFGVVVSGDTFGFQREVNP